MAMTRGRVLTHDVFDENEQTGKYVSFRPHELRKTGFWRNLRTDFNASKEAGKACRSATVLEGVVHRLAPLTHDVSAKHVKMLFDSCCVACKPYDRHNNIV